MTNWTRCGPGSADLVFRCVLKATLTARFAGRVAFRLFTGGNMDGIRFGVNMMTPGTRAGRVRLTIYALNEPFSARSNSNHERPGTGDATVRSATCRPSPVIEPLRRS